MPRAGRLLDRADSAMLGRFAGLPLAGFVASTPTSLLF
jgi:hypothetical protein